jgi:hypothetical protein
MIIVRAFSPPRSLSLPLSFSVSLIWNDTPMDLTLGSKVLSEKEKKENI